MRQETAGRWKEMMSKYKMSSLLNINISFSLEFLFNIYKWFYFRWLCCIFVHHFSSVTYFFKPREKIYPRLPCAEKRSCPGGSGETECGATV